MNVLSRRDLRFLLHDWLRADELVDPDLLEQVMDLAQDLAENEFAPHNRRNDLEEPRFVDGEAVLHDEVGPAVQKFADAGLLGMGMPPEVGGMGLPNLVTTAVMAWFQAANLGTAGYPFLTIANANMLLAHASPEQIETFVRPMVEGRFFGTMVLSEPHAGSSLADITTTATPQPDGTYRVTGNKMWISGGSHELGENIVHNVLAKVPGGPPGSKGISMFIVPRVLDDGSRNAIELVGLNHKLGYRGTVNTELRFENAVGHLVGQEGRGLPYMFHAMNEARIGVGLVAAALGCTGYLHAVQYARERTQGRHGRDPSTPMVPIIEHPDVRRMLLAQKAYAEGALALVLYCARLLDQDDDESGLLLEMLTPIAKSWPSQWCLEANSLAIQVHGGAGYTRDFPVEQFWRDQRLNMIHEGTHGIQALDLLGRKTRLHEGAGLALLRERMARTAAAWDGPEGEQLVAMADRLVDVTHGLWGSGDAEVVLANATPYLEATGHLVVAWIWLEQLLAVGDGDEDLHHGKRAAARYFFRYELPKVGPMLDLLESLDRTTLDARPEWFVAG